MHRHDGAARKSAIGGSPSTVAVATRQKRQRDSIDAGCRFSRRLLHKGPFEAVKLKRYEASRTQVIGSAAHCCHSSEVHRGERSQGAQFRRMKLSLEMRCGVENHTGS